MRLPSVLSTFLLASLFCTSLPIAVTAQTLSPTPYRTAHVELYSDMPPQRAQWYANFCEKFLHEIEQQFCPLVGKYPMRAIILHDKPAFAKYMRDTMHEPHHANVYGCYFASNNTFFSYDGSGLGTMTHEIMHKVCIDGGMTQEAWAREGIPTFFEKFYGYFDGPRLIMYMGFQNPWRLRELGSSVTTRSIKDIVEGATGDSNDESAQRLVSVFLYQNGCLRKYFDLVRARNKQNQQTYVESAMGRRMAEIEPLWKQYTEDIVRRADELQRLPGSQVFDSKQQFEAFAVNQKLRFPRGH